MAPIVRAPFVSSRTVRSIVRRSHTRNGPVCVMAITAMLHSSSSERRRSAILASRFKACFRTENYHNSENSVIPSHLPLAIRAARSAGTLLREGLTRSHDIRYKEGVHNLVTEMDTAAEALIIETIRGEYPDHTFLAEESGAAAAVSPFRWIIDPLDGTVNYAHGLPIFCVSIALEHEGHVVCGAIYNPMLDEMFTAELGGGAHLNGEKIAVSAQTEFQKSMLVTGFPYDAYKNTMHCIDHFVNFVKEGRPVRRLGSAALDLAYVACGRFEGFWEVKLNPWDVAAGSLILREAGGLITKLDGSAWTIDEPSLLATNGKIHEAMLGVIRKAG